MKPFLYHVHGMGGFDFSSLTPEDLIPLNRLAEERGQEILPTVFLRRGMLSGLVDVLKHYDVLHNAGELPNIAGFAVEGPLLGPEGGVPQAGKWLPTEEEWRTLAGLGDLGLRYLVLAPDAMELDERVSADLTFAGLLELFYDHGCRAAFGHFHHDAPERSARRTRDVVAHLHSVYESSPYLVLTDHLYNDMPRAFAHCWRTAEERARRTAELTPFLAHDWETADLEALLGPVPATLLTLTREGLLTPCLNFDGLHVDLEVCRRTVDYVGAGRLAALTDHIEVGSMAGEKLSVDDVGLWRRKDGIVAAGTTDYAQQRLNMLAVGLTEDDVRAVFSTVPRAAIAHRPRRRPAG
jgi:N-acetylglucosamine-6-phosphate deacetylase